MKRKGRFRDHAERGRKGEEWRKRKAKGRRRETGKDEERRKRCRGEAGNDE